MARDGRVLVLRRPERGETRLPKGHVEWGEAVESAALRETREESGYHALVVKDDLGSQTVTFEHLGRRVLRTERYFLVALEGAESDRRRGEDQFEPAWLPWEEALAELTFESEREWVRRAQKAVQQRGRRAYRRTPDSR